MGLNLNSQSLLSNGVRIQSPLILLFLQPARYAVETTRKCNNIENTRLKCVIRRIHRNRHNLYFREIKISLTDLHSPIGHETLGATPRYQNRRERLLCNAALCCQPQNSASFYHNARCCSLQVRSQSHSSKSRLQRPAQTSTSHRSQQFELR